MTTEEKISARADIEATGDLLERALKLAGLLATLFHERGFPLVVVGGSAVEFYTKGGRSRRRFPVRKPIVVEWEEWKASRTMKREALRRAGLDAPSRRKNPVGTSDLRLRRAFGGNRVPNWAERDEKLLGKTGI